jgi:hypothetical protein
MHADDVVNADGAQRRADFGADVQAGGAEDVGVVGDVGAVEGADGGVAGVDEVADAETGVALVADGEAEEVEFVVGEQFNARLDKPVRVLAVIVVVGVVGVLDALVGRAAEQGEVLVDFKLRGKLPVASWALLIWKTERGVSWMSSSKP